MVVYPAPMLVLAPALVVNVVLAARGVWLRRTPATRPGLRVPVAAVLALLVLGAGCGLWFDTWERRVPILIGLLLGALLGLAWEWAWPAHDEDAADLGPLASGLAVLAGLGLALPAGVPLANASLGLLAGWGVLQVLTVAMSHQAEHGTMRGVSPGLALPAIGLTAGTMAWGARLPVLPSGAVSGLWPLALGLATLAVLGFAVAELTGTRRSGIAGAVVAALVFLLGSLALAGGPFQQPPALMLGLAAGAAAGVFAAFWLPEDGPTTAVSGLTLLVVAGGVLVLENRLMGIMAMGLGGLGLLAGARGRLAPRPLVVVAIAVFATRVWLQLFLDRTNLTGYGVDLTHPYAFAALIVGGLLPTAALAVGRVCRPLPTLSVAWALALAVLPAWLGYMIHVEALGGLLAGLVLAAFTLSARDSDDAPVVLAVVPSLLLLTLSVTMLAAPWLIEHMNAARDERLHWFLGSIVLIVLAVGRWWWSTRQPRVA